MEAKEYVTIDRAKWPSGPWDGEPDKVQWPDAKTGLPCLAVRNSRSGHWCGYVGVAEGHPLFGRNYNDVSLDVHCGLTFSDKCQPRETEASGICHVPAPGESDHVWWLGFDCAHCDDLSPGDLQMYKEMGRLWKPFDGQVYRSLDYVKGQCAHLAQQIADGMQ
jgi:hypothetical protein